MIFIFSLLWTPPIIWFVIVFAVLLLFQTYDKKTLISGAVALAVVAVTLAWPSKPFWEQIYSPYQLLERGYGPHSSTVVSAAGTYFQKIHDYSKLDQDDPRDDIARYYELPYRTFGSPGRAAIVGSGTGNDVAAALRCGVEHVDAIEIDPAILQIGRFFHPEKPYSDPRVTPIVNDARTFLRNTDQTYDMIVYGLLDSHTLLSHASNVRVDSFVYTVEALREARDRLDAQGMLSLSFCIISPELGRKIYIMLNQAFDGQEPLCLKAQKDHAVIFLVRKGDAPIALPPPLLAGDAFEDVTAVYRDSSIQTDPSTDDWPFFYMPRRVYPLSYLMMIGLILVLSVCLVKPFFTGSTASQWKLNHGVFFLLGAGFMLIETKNITELGLIFGNTWQVIGIAIAGILTMAFLANCMVQWFQLRRVTIPLLLLLMSLALGLIISQRGGFSSTGPGRLGTLLVLTCPLFFSGICFSSMLGYTTDISGAMAANLVGAMAGGLLEYNSMYFGFQWLYWLTLTLYGAALLVFLAGRLGEPGLDHARQIS